MRQAQVHRIPAAGPDDVSGIEALIAGGRLNPASIVAIIGKTEGNGCVNDFSRGYAAQSLGLMLERHLAPEAARQVCLVMSGGTEGGMSPHWIVFTRAEVPGLEGGPSLAIGRAHTPDLPPEGLGRMAQVRMVAEGVEAAMRDAGISDHADVHFVQVKCPLLTSTRVAAAEARGETVAVKDTLRSMGYSRGASALGVALALGEVQAEQLSDEAICRDWSLASSVASCSAGIELLGHEIVLMGVGPDWGGPLTIEHGVMTDAIDIEPVRAALMRAGLSPMGQLGGTERLKMMALLGKAEASPDGKLRGLRHTMLDDSDISSTRHARGFVAGALAGLIGHAEIYVSGGAEHQGPPGGGPVAVIVSK
ncbi:ring-opening amidohydrolase [Acetobacteraceae bacterium H6797]|nr:ring-opening amidohydrolase [Acetobacteraceae bacterium H6797]